MKVRILSDLHLEFSDLSLSTVNYDVAILAWILSALMETFTDASYPYWDGEGACLSVLVQLFHLFTINLRHHSNGYGGRGRRLWLNWSRLNIHSTSKTTKPNHGEVIGL
jgi:hypothetical protein